MLSLQRSNYACYLPLTFQVTPNAAPWPRRWCSWPLGGLSDANTLNLTADVRVRGSRLPALVIRDKEQARDRLTARLV